MTEPLDPGYPVPDGWTAHGVVELTGGCVVLVTEAERIALVGPRVRELRHGQPVTVRGRVAPLPPDCPADRALLVTDLEDDLPFGRFQW
ncbi:hypothetical protein [Carbonactinospora thermoautotrophica]|uniref:hypothetical protein n=1 Tax=Carbonactinospora thermoautotrophica TaxID=1469144 RepID=UPI00082F859A|nr:hypothetical protein [Carbonactinospora thermoautotrophica]